MEIKLTNVLYLKKGFIINLMRTFIFLFCTTVFSFNTTNMFSQKSKINIENDMTITVDQVFDMIKSQTNYNFIYQEGLFKNVPKVSLKKGKIKTNQLLEIILSKGHYEIGFDSVDTILIKGVSKTTQRILHGKVTDKEGTPLPGVTIVNNTTIRGVATDFNGDYNITINSGDNLTFSYIGFAAQKFVISDQTTLDVQMLEEESQLDEVVLIGYGTQKRGEVSSAISSIKAADIEQNLVGQTSFDVALNGLIKGVKITQSSGQPGAGADINIRGITSPFAGADNNPLFVIDGVPFQTNPTFSINDATAFINTGNPLQSLNPSDIESIDILKDAAATSIYGSRGANGVILVKTKRGKKNEKMVMSFNSTSTFAKPIGTNDYLNPTQWQAFNDEFFKYSADFANASPAVNIFSLRSAYGFMANLEIDFSTFTLAYNGPVDGYYGTANTNWADEVYRDPAYTQQYNVSVYGGSEKTNYLASLGYTDQEGLLIGEKYRKYNLRIGVDSEINDKLTVGATANIGVSTNKTGYNDAFGNGDLNNLLQGRPDIAPRDDEGNFNYFPGTIFGFPSQTANPLAKVTGHDLNTKGLTFIGNTYIEAEVVKNLKIKSDVNVSIFATDHSAFSPTSIVGDILPSFFGVARSTLNTSTAINTNTVANLTANYNNTFNKHTVSVLGGFAWDRSITDRKALNLIGFPDDEVLINITAGAEVNGKGGTKIETGLNSIFGRVSYSYDNKYFATANMRTDRSIKFAPNNQRAFFPSLALSWNVRNEGFMSTSKFNSLRLRASLGETGSNNVGDFAYLQFFGPGIFFNSSYGGVPNIGLTGTLPNPDIKWEKTREFNIGVDYAMFNRRLRGTFDLYDRKTTGALIPTPYPLSTGATNFIANLADLSNKGFELEIGGDIIKTENLTWSLDINLSKNTNKLEKFNVDGIAANNIDLYEIGKEVNLIKGYVVEKIFQDQAEVDALNASAPDGLYQRLGTAPGDYKYVDLNGDGEITLDDRKYLGSAQPDFFGGFNTQVQYKGFSLGAYFNYSVGGESTWSSFGNKFRYTAFNNTYSMFYNNTWTPERIDAKYPRVIAFDPNNNRRTSSETVYDTSYLRLKTLQLSYQFPKEVIENLKVIDLSMFVSGSNLWTASDFPGINPEASLGGFASASGTVNRDPYPIAKSWSLGINVKF